MDVVANRRYVVIGRRTDGVEAPLKATDDLEEAQAYRDGGERSIGGRLWEPVRIIDRRARPDLPALHEKHRVVS